MKPTQNHPAFPAFASWIAAVADQIKAKFDCSDQDVHWILNMYDHHVNYVWSVDYDSHKAAQYIASKIHYHPAI
jgi:hypothetical protein